MEAEPQARLPSPVVSLLEEEPPEHWAWQASRASIQGPPRMGETDSTLGGHTQVLRVKAEMPHEPGPDLLSGLGGSPWEVGVAVSRRHHKSWWPIQWGPL